MSKSKIFDAFGPVPATVPPSTKVRHWDQGILAGAFAFSVSYTASTFLAFHFPGTDTHIAAQWGSQAWGGLLTGMHYLMGGYALDEPAARFLASIRPDRLGAALRVGLPLLGSVAATWWLVAHALTPRNGVRHIAGPELLEGKRALLEAKNRSISVKERATDPGHLALHPCLVLPKKHWSRHTLIYGSVGSGKTQILLPIINMIIRRNHKLFLYDVKGDFTSYFKRPIIVSPFDARSYVWDVGADVRTPTQASAFAASLIPEDQGTGKFWSIAAQQILIGVLRELQNEHGTDWSWAELAKNTSRTAEEMAPALRRHYAKAYPLIANEEAQSTASVLATLASYTRVIDDLALAWPRIGKRRFSISEWLKDDYQGRRQIIVQGGEGNLTKAYIAAMVNIAAERISSPSMPDNESQRFLGFIFDELSSVGKINFTDLVDKGRSRGVVFLGGVQGISQIKLLYGPETAEAIASMVGTHIICQVQMGETRKQLAEMMGSRKVAITSNGPNPRATEEGTPVIHAAELTDKLGFRRGKAFGQHGWGIRAIVQMGGDPLLLDFPGQQFEKVREGQIAATWTTKPAGAQLPPLSTVQPIPEDKAQRKADTVEVLKSAKKRALTAVDLDDFLPKI